MNGKIKIGDIVYYLQMRPYQMIRFGMYEINFGIVEERYPGVAVIQLYETPDRRLVNGIPVKEFVTPSKWEKLPKGWMYNTELFKLDWKPMPEEWKNFRVDKPEDVRKAIECGALVKVWDNDHSHIETEIDKTKGWRIVRNYPQDEYHPNLISLNLMDVYSTYEEAKAKLDEIEAELKRQANLSDYDWSVEQIDSTLNRWAKLYEVPDDIKKKYRDWILNLDNIEDVETRIANGGVQWKYDKNKKWKNIEII